MQQLINDILHDMSEVLSAKELYTLQIVLQKKLNTQNNQTYPYTNIEYMDMFIIVFRLVRDVVANHKTTRYAGAATKVIQKNHLA